MAWLSDIYLDQLLLIPSHLLPPPAEPKEEGGEDSKDKEEQVQRTETMKTALLAMAKASLVAAKWTTQQG